MSVTVAAAPDLQASGVGPRSSSPPQASPSTGMTQEQAAHHSQPSHIPASGSMSSLRRNKSSRSGKGAAAGGADTAASPTLSPSTFQASPLPPSTSFAAPLANTLDWGGASSSAGSSSGVGDAYAGTSSSSSGSSPARATATGTLKRQQATATSSTGALPTAKSSLVAAANAHSSNAIAAGVAELQDNPDAARQLREAGYVSLSSHRPPTQGPVVLGDGAPTVISTSPNAGVLRRSKTVGPNVAGSPNEPSTLAAAATLGPSTVPPVPPVMPSSLTRSQTVGAAAGGLAAEARRRDKTITGSRPVGAGGGVDLKVVILGAQGVGKTSLVHRYTTGQFSASSIPSTIGASFLTQKLLIDGTKVRLQLWDTAGQERFRSMAPMYYRGAHAAVIVYDITNSASFNDIKSWIDELRRNVTSDLIIHVVGSKADLAPARRDVYLDEAQEAVSNWTRPPAAVPATLPLSAASQVSPTKSASRLGLGTLSLGMSSSTSRLGFPRTGSPPRGSTPGAASASNASGSGGSDPGGVSGEIGDSSGMLRDDLGSPTSLLPWDVVEVTEVSAKDGRGIEDVFVSIAQRLVERKLEIEEEQRRRERHSVLLHDAAANGGERDAAGSGGVWSCCA